MNSMTGFGSAALSAEGREISIEIKSVNHRFLDVVLKLPKNVSFLESAFRERIGRGLNRGHVELYINYQNRREDARTVAVDTAMLQQYLDAFDRVSQQTALLDEQLTPGDIMRMQDVLTVSEGEDDQQAVEELAVSVLDRALLGLKEMRAVEGEKLKLDVAGRLDNLQTIFLDIEKLAPTVPQMYGEKLRQRVEELLGEVEVDQQRLANEIALFADKSNIDEEIARFHSHIDQFQAMLDCREPVGRKMDFTLQELNREVNTIGSKANNAQMTSAVLELKAELEKMREQVQNIE